MVYFLNKILPDDICNIIRDILIGTYINKYINIQMWNINVITEKHVYNKHIIRQQTNYIYENIKTLYCNHFIKYNIKDRYISNTNAIMLNNLIKWCKFILNHINNKKQFNVKYKSIQLSNSPFNHNLTELYILEKINQTINTISKNDLNVHRNLKKLNEKYNNNPICNDSIIITHMNQLIM
jgi:hypothetical protein|tara:strand:+ start:3031 stop:3573 length:543 start_codon:yes stop_codon:yes gene_type:complete